MTTARPSLPADAGGREPAAQAALPALLRPGVALMRRLTQTQRLALVCGLMLLPLALMSALGLHRWNQKADALAAERKGLTVHLALMDTVTAAQALRKQAVIVEARESTPPAALAAARQHLEQRTAALDRLLRAVPLARFEGPWQPLSRRLQALAAATPADLAGGTAGDVIDDLRALGYRNGEVSGLLFDPEPRAYFLMDVTVLRSLALVEAAARSRDAGWRLLHARGNAAHEQTEAQSAASELRRGVDGLQVVFDALARAGGVVPGSWPGTHEAAKAYAEHLTQRVAGDHASGDERRHRELSEATLQRLLAVHADSVVRLNQEFDAREQWLRAKLVIIGGLCAATLLGLLYAITVSALALRGSLLALLRDAGALADGDLSGKVEVSGRDEVARVGGVLDRLGMRLSELVAAIRTDAAHVAMAGSRLAEESGTLSIRAQELGANLSDASHAIGALGRDVAASAEEAGRLDELTGRLHERSLHASQAMEDTVRAMVAVQQTSGKVTAVVDVIDDLAFQTGMLALNAAIEAARAGAAGDRFAIVAGEVRQLAQRSAESADQIRQLLADSANEVHQAAGLLKSASSGSRSVTEAIDDASRRLRALSQASRSHSSDLEAITAMIGNLDELTRSNSRLVEQAATASSELMARADRLSGSVASVRLRQGSADEAKAMVERAMEHWQRVGRERALADFHDPAAGFIDRDLFIVVLDRDGYYQAYGPRPEIVGRLASDMPGLDLRQLMPLAAAAADAGGGWVECDTLNPTTGDVQRKDSWVVPCGEREMMLCGVFRDHAQGAAEPGKAWRDGGASAIASPQASAAVLATA